MVSFVNHHQSNINKMSKSVLTITLNPCIDKSSTVRGIVPEKKLRCETPKYEPGGGGINVSRALKRLGIASGVFFTSGGRTGKLLEELLHKEKLDILPLPVENETRENFIVVDTLNNQQFRFGFPGQSISGEEQINILKTIESINPFPDITVISGSLPEEVRPEFIKDIIRICKHQNSKVIVDTSGKSLEIAVDEGVFLVKPNIGELAMLSGKSELTDATMDEAANKLIETGKVEIIVVSLGAKGAVQYSGKERIWQAAPIVKVRSTVGAGDSMVAGMISVLVSGGTMGEMLKKGISCGSATTMAEGTGLFRAEDVEKLYRNLKNNG